LQIKYISTKITPPIYTINQWLYKISYYYDISSKIIILCSIGVRSYNAARVLMENGFKNVKVYPAGTNFYKAVYYKYFNAQTPSQDIGQSINVKQTVNYSDDNISSTDIKASIKVDCSGLQCPGPIMKVFETMNKMNDGDIIEVSATDSGFAKD